MSLTNRKTRTGSVYLAVMGTALLVSLMGMTAMHLARVELRAAQALQHRDYAKSLAQSSVEFAIAKIKLNPVWRLTHTHDQVRTASPTDLGAQLQYKYLDPADNNLNDGNDHPVEIRGIGEYRGATHVYSVTYAPSYTGNNLIGPQVLRSYDTTGGSSASENVNEETWLGQYFVPELPAEATEWSVTEVEVSARQYGASNVTMYIRLYEADAAGMPTNLLESTFVEKWDLPAGSFDWVTVNFTTVSGRPAGSGLCLGLEGDSIQMATVQYENAGAAADNTHMLVGGNGSWTSAEPDKSLFYRIRGFYTTASGATGDFELHQRSWRRISAD